MRVLIIRLRAIGDVVHALPVACAIKDHFPGAFVGWVVEPWAAEVLSGHEAIDRLFVVPGRWQRSFSRIRQLRRDLGACGFEVALDLQGVGSSVLAALLSGAGRRLGFIGTMTHRLRRVVRSETLLHGLSRAMAAAIRLKLVRATSEHIVDRYLEILRPLGVAAPSVRFQMPERPEDAAAVERLLQDAALQAGAYAAINPGGPAFRMWPAGRFAAAARHLGRAHRLRSVVIQGRWERERLAAQEVVAGAGGHALLAPAMPLGQLGALARRARLFLSGDTGPLHLAAAVGAPCLGLFGDTLARRVRPYGPGNVALQGRELPRHVAGDRRLAAEALAEIGVDEVCRACDRMLQGGPQAP